MGVNVRITLISLLTLVGGLFIGLRPVAASCSPLTGYSCPLGTTVECTTSTGEYFCCTESSDECKTGASFDTSGLSGSSGKTPLPEAGASACKNIQDSDDRSECVDCFNGGGAYTALGCFGENGDPGTFISQLIKSAVGVGGGIAFLLILFAGFQTMTSTGNPEKLHAARELLTAAISGLLLIIFSLLLLKIIGVDILEIPEFGSASSSSHYGPRFDSE